jgi:uncharacterized repeat protein (TIGR03837 family)
VLSFAYGQANRHNLSQLSTLNSQLSTLNSLPPPTWCTLPHVRIHIYCSVVDNFGDIGVCWRLAKQLRAEYGWQSVLWVDDWASARALLPALGADARAAQVDDVVLRPWSEVDAPVDCTGDVFVEGFACTPPAAALEQLRTRADKPVWVNLEYFSAEAWVDRTHGLSGWIDERDARRWFFVPGVTAHSGGMLRERDLLTRCAAWTAVDAARLTRELGLVQSPDQRTLLCFAYAHAPYDALCAALRDAPATVWLCGRYSQRGLHADLRAGAGESRFVDAPFVPHARFDSLLWSADALFVRGEDSLLRALWSGKPMIWQIYPQDADAHVPKLDAWLTHYLSGWPESLATLLRDAHAAWNRLSGAPDFEHVWRALLPQWDAWRVWSLRSRDRLALGDDLARRFTAFVSRQR